MEIKLDVPNKYLGGHIIVMVTQIGSTAFSLRPQNGDLRVVASIAITQELRDLERQAAAPNIATKESTVRSLRPRDENLNR
jgi:hypothetical protein